MTLMILNEPPFLGIEQCLTNGRCPVCEKIIYTGQLFIARLSQEPAASEEFSTGDWCLKHFRQLECLDSTAADQLRELAAAKQLARLGQAIEEYTALARSPWKVRVKFFKKRLRPQAAVPVVPVAPCPACEAETAARAAATAEMAAFVQSEAGRTKYGTAPFLCWDHLVGVLLTSEPGAAQFLASCHIARMQDWENRFAEYFRKREYRHAEEPKGPEQNTWREALMFFCGLSPKSSDQ